MGKRNVVGRPVAKWVNDMVRIGASMDAVSTGSWSILGRSDTGLADAQSKVPEVAAPRPPKGGGEGGARHAQ